MPLGRDVDLGPGDIVLYGDPSPSKCAQQPPPLFGPCLLWPNGRPSQLLLSSCEVRCAVAAAAAAVFAYLSASVLERDVCTISRALADRHRTLCTSLIGRLR